MNFVEEKKGGWMFVKCKMHQITTNAGGTGDQTDNNRHGQNHKTKKWHDV